MTTHLLVQPIHRSSMFINQRLRLGTRFLISSAHTSSRRKMHLLVQINRESIIMVPPIRILRKAILPVHIRDLLLKTRLLPQRQHFDSGGIFHAAEVLQAGFWREPSCDDTVRLSSWSGVVMRNASFSPYSSCTTGFLMLRIDFPWSLIHCTVHGTVFDHQSG